MIEYELPLGLNSQPDSLEKLIESMTYNVYTRLRQAVELGKWPDGNVLSEEQLEQSLQLVILYGERNLPSDQRIGAPMQNTCKTKEPLINVCEAVSARQKSAKKRSL